MLCQLAVALSLSASTTVEPGFPGLDQVTIYEANLRAEGSNEAFRSLTNRLESIQSLGINTIWLMPVYPVGKLKSAGGLGSPYSVSNFDALNPEFGSESDFRTLITRAHELKLRVILDWVPNHTAWDHPWIQLHPNWYSKNEKGEIIIPSGTNWQDVADLDYDNNDLRNRMTKSMVGWINKYDIDGFRVDTADWVPDEYWKSAISEIRLSTVKPLIMLAEGFGSKHFDSGFDLRFGWPFYDETVKVIKGESAKQIRSAAKHELKGVPEQSRHLRFITNHDKAAWEGTPLETFGSDEAIKVATVVTYLYPGGTPLVYSGQEVAWTERIPIFDRSSISWTLRPDRREFISQLLSLRKQNPFNVGASSDFSNDDVVAFHLKYQNKESIVLANMRSKQMAIEIPQRLHGEWNDHFIGRQTAIGSAVTLKAYQYSVLIR